MSKWRLQTNLVLAAIAAILLVTTAEAQRRPPSASYPRLYTSDVAVLVPLQRMLFVNKCYGNQLTRKDEVDGEAGPLTRAAINVFVDEFKARNPKARQVGGSPFATPEELLQATVKAWQDAKAGDAKFCERSRFRRVHFPSRSQHIDWAETHQALYPKTKVSVVRVQTELYANGCFGNVLSYEDDTDDSVGTFGSLSKKALHVFVEEYQLRFRGKRIANPDELEEALVQVNADASTAKRFCVGSKFLRLYFSDSEDRQGDANGRLPPPPSNPNVCEITRATGDWLRSQEAAGRANYKGSAQLEPLSPVLDKLEAALTTYLEVISEQAPPNSDLLGTIERYRATYRNLRQSLDSVAKGKEQLARLGTIAQNMACQRCYLLADFEWMSRFTEGGVLPVLEPSGRPAQDDRSKRAMVVDVGVLTFDDLLKAHRAVREWRLKEEEFLKALRAGTSSSQSFDDQRKSRLEADTARYRALFELYTSNRDGREARATRPRSELAIEFARNRSTNCVGDFSLDARR